MSDEMTARAREALEHGEPSGFGQLARDVLDLAAQVTRLEEERDDLRAWGNELASHLATAEDSLNDAMRKLAAEHVNRLAAEQWMSGDICPHCGATATPPRPGETPASANAHSPSGEPESPPVEQP